MKTNETNTQPLATFAVGDKIRQNGATYKILEKNWDKERCVVQNCVAGFVCTFSFEAEFCLVEDKI